MRGPFLLPADIDEGDWIELGQLGAYGACLRTGFNGFGGADLVEVAESANAADPGLLERIEATHAPIDRSPERAAYRLTIRRIARAEEDE